METFQLYQDEYMNNKKSLEEKIKVYDASTASESDLKEIEDLFKQADAVLKEMSLGLDSQTKKTVSLQMSDFKNSLINLKNIFEKEKLKQNKSSLMGDKSFEDRQKLVDTQTKYVLL
jgi:hypothetical protein